MRPISASSAGPRRRRPEPRHGAYGSSGLPKLHEDQHVLMGQNPKTELQTEEVPHQTAPRGICKYSGRLRTAFFGSTKAENDGGKFRISYEKNVFSFFTTTESGRFQVSRIRRLLIRYDFLGRSL